MMPETREERVRFLLAGFNVQKFYSLKGKVSGYPSFNKLICKFQEFLDGKCTDTDRLLSLCDEIAVANWLFSLFENSLVEAVCEQKLPGGKNIDFLIKTKDGRNIYFDVKTLNPDTKDDWDKYQKANKENHFSSNTGVILDKNYLGGEIFHAMRTAREKMLDHALGLEEKIASMEKRDKNIFILVLCGKGLTLHDSWVEDFAHFYFSGKHRGGDAWGKMILHHLGEKKISVRGSIDYFIHMERGGPGYTPNAEVDKIMHKMAASFVSSGESSENAVSEYKKEYIRSCETPDRFIKFGLRKKICFPEFAKECASEEQIDEAKEKLLAVYHPKAIYLFGSYVWGVKLPDADSDLDFMVVIQDDPEEDMLRRSLKGRNALARFPFPKDILVHTVAEFVEMAAYRSTLCYNVKNKGKLLYEAP